MFNCKLFISFLSLFLFVIIILFLLIKVMKTSNSETNEQWTTKNIESELSSELFNNHNKNNSRPSCRSLSDIDFYVEGTTIPQEDLLFYFFFYTSFEHTMDISVADELFVITFFYIYMECTRTI